MKISVYTFVRDGLYYDFHVVEMLKHHIPFADEIIVNEGYSSDKTYERIKDIHPKIKIYRNHWDETDPTSWHRKFKDITRQYCCGDWCILLDCDEFIPEWEFEPIRRYLTNTDKDIVPLNYINFYGNYKVYNSKPHKHRWPATKHTIHRNLAEIEVWGDGSNVRFKGYDDKSKYSDNAFECHHFGFVRNPARLRQKWRIQNRVYGSKDNGFKWIPKFLFALFPHKWVDPDFIDDLTKYEGPYINTVLENPTEFVRDKFQLYELLNKHE